MGGPCQGLPRRGTVTPNLDRNCFVQYNQCMRTITINVSESVYRDFQEHARRNERSTSDLIREAMREYRERNMNAGTSLRELRPSSVGAVLNPLQAGEDLLAEMLDDQRG